VVRIYIAAALHSPKRAFEYKKEKTEEPIIETGFACVTAFGTYGATRMVVEVHGFFGITLPRARTVPQ
jgi:hypothetical protein